MENEMQIARLEPAVITADFEAMQERLDGYLAPYRGVTAEAVSLMDAKEVKACATDLRKMRRSLDDSRKAVKRAYNEPLAAFESSVKKLVSQIDDCLTLFADAEKAEKERYQREKRDELRGIYEDMAPALVPVVPYERLEDPKWLNKTTAINKAIDELAEKVDRIAKDWETLKRVKLAFPGEAEALFFRTLSIMEAIAHDDARRKEQERIEAMRQEVEENRAAMQDDVLDGLERDEEVRRYHMDFNATREQLAQIVSFMKSIGVSGNASRYAE